LRLGDFFPEIKMLLAAKNTDLRLDAIGAPVVAFVSP
jgi:hypothetical protein